jgi:Mn2+/Fe2+ NRAMP family transporter
LLTVSLVFLSYVITGFMAKPDWGAVGGHFAVPTFHFTLPYLTILIGIIGTTIAPWMQFYLQSSVVDKGLGEREYHLERVDVYVGSFFTNFIAFFIIVTTAAALFAHGKPADTVTDIAQTLRPLAGDFTARLFAIGLLNASLMAAVVLPLSTAYAVCEAFGWERSVNRPLREAPAFFGLFAALIAIGAAVAMIPGVPLLTLMFLPNVVNGILLPVVLLLMLRLINDRGIMGLWVNSPLQNVIARLTTGLIVALTAAYLIIAILEGVGVLTG